MTKALLKKQLLEVFSWVFQNKKTGKNRSGGKLALYVLLYLFIFGFLGVMFYIAADMLCAPLLSVGLGWLYMALMGVLGVTMGVFGSVFSTYSTLYRAKDNDLLLSMPVPSRTVLTARLSGVFAIGLLYELLVMVPTVIVFFLNARLTFPGAVFSLLMPFILAVFVLTLSCVLGWIVAWVSGKLKNQKIITVVLSLLFFAGYYYLCGNAGFIFQMILADPSGLGKKVKGILYPLYHMGLAAEGNVVSMVIFTGILLGLFFVVYLILSRSFLKLAITNRGASRVKYVEKSVKPLSPGRALLKKEFRRFLGSPTYMLNCGLGIVFMIFAAVVLIIKGDVLRIAALSVYEELMALVAAAAICMITAMNDISAPSVSLEGKTIWLTKVLPVSGWQVLAAKLKMHLILTMIPAAVLILSVEWVLTPSPLFAVEIPAAAALFILMMAALGLVMNLKMPNLTWTSEVVPIKQSASVMITMFGGWIIVLALGAAYYFLSSLIAPGVFLSLVIVLFLAADLLLLGWLRTKGGRIFEQLTV